MSSNSPVKCFREISYWLPVTSLVIFLGFDNFTLNSRAAKLTTKIPKSRKSKLGTWKGQHLLCEQHLTIKQLKTAKENVL